MRSVSGTGSVTEQHSSVELKELVAGRPSLPATLVAQSLKVVVSSGAVVTARRHTTVLKSVESSHMGRGHCDRASRSALCQNERSAVHASRAFRTGSPCVAFYWARKRGKSSESWSGRMVHLRGAEQSLDVLGSANSLANRLIRTQGLLRGRATGEVPANMGVNLTVRSVTRPATTAGRAPVRPAGYARR